MPLILSSMGRQRPRKRATSARRPAFAISRTTPSTRCSFPCRDDSPGTRMGRLSRPRHPRQRNRPHGPDRRDGGMVGDSMQALRRRRRLHGVRVARGVRARGQALDVEEGPEPRQRACRGVLRHAQVRLLRGQGLDRRAVRGVLPAAPFVKAAYVGIWLALAVYAFVLSRRAKRTERDLGALKQALVAREEKLKR